MIYKKLFSSVLLLLLLAPMNLAYLQNDDKTKEERLAELKTNAKELLRDTSAMALNLASPTNRINFTVRSADILWDMEETDARAMFSTSIGDVKRLISQVDFEMNQQNSSRNSTWTGRGSRISLSTKTNQAFSLRSQLVTALSNHDPEWALRFVQETSQMVTNPKLVKRFERENKRFESQIIRKIASKDVSKALELGREKLSKGVTSDILSLLKDIYGKDQEKGSEFAKDVLQKLKDSAVKRNLTRHIVSLFQYAVGTMDSDKTPLLDKSSLSALADLLAKHVTASTSRYKNLSDKVMLGLEKYSPNSAAQVKQTFDQRNAGRNARRGNRNPISKTFSGNEDQKERSEERSKFQNEINKDLNNLGNENLSAEDKEAIINQTKSKILSVNDDKYRFKGLVNLAIRVAVMGDKESAAGILYDAETYMIVDPKERNDYAQSQTLANAYALVDTDRSFSILENMIYRLNGVINGYIKFMEFSGNRRILENGELIMNSRSQQFTRYLNLYPQTLRNLAENDYSRLKDLTDKFERPEIRVETRLLIAKALLNATVTQEEKKNKEKIETVASLQNLESQIRTTEEEFQKIADIIEIKQESVEN